MSADLTATLSSPNDVGLLDATLGRRLANVSFGTAANAGYSTLTARLLGHDRSDYLPLGQALEVFRSWRFCVLRLFLAGERVWTGRVWRITLSDLRRDARGGVICAVSLEGDGFWRDNTNLIASVAERYMDEGATVSASQLAQDVIKGDEGWWLIEENYTELQQTGTNVGPISAGYQDYPHDLLVQALRAGSSDGVEYAYYIWEPVDGVVMKPRGGATSATPRWRVSMLDSGLSVVWDGEEYASSVRALYTDAENNAQTTDPNPGVNDGPIAQAGVDIHGGVRRERAISLDRVNKTGAESGVSSYLALHYDPVGLAGPYRLRPRRGEPYAMITNWEGAREPAYRVRAGDVVELYDLLPGDPYLADNGRLRRFAVDATRYNVATGEVEITLDARPLRSREHERPAKIANALRVMEPLMSRKLLVQVDGSSTDLTISNDTLVSTFGTNGVITFSVTRRTKIAVELAARFYKSDSSQSCSYYLGYELNNQGWDSNNEDRSARFVAANVNEISSAHTFSQVLEGQVLLPGQYSLRLWASETASTGTVTLDRPRVKIWG